MELQALRRYIKRTLTSRALSRETSAWERGWEPDSDDDPENHFWAWRRQLDGFAWEFRNNRRLYRRFEFAKEKLDRLVARLEKRRKNKEGDLAAAAVDETKTDRSVFDDVDQ